MARSKKVSNALSLLRLYQNRRAKNRLPWTQILSLPPLSRMRRQIRHAGEAGPMEPRRSEMAWSQAIEERLAPGAKTRATRIL